MVTRTASYYPIVTSVGIHGSILALILISSKVLLPQWTVSSNHVGPLWVEMANAVSQKIRTVPDQQKASPGALAAADDSAARNKSWPIEHRDSLATAANPGSAAMAYQLLVRTKIQNELHYPISLRRRHITGLVNLKISLNQNGTLAGLELTQSSGTPELDQLALESVRSAAPFPPTALSTSNLILDLPIDFKIR